MSLAYLNSKNKVYYYQKNSPYTEKLIKKFFSDKKMFTMVLPNCKEYMCIFTDENRFFIDPHFSGRKSAKGGLMKKDFLNYPVFKDNIKNVKDVLQAIVIQFLVKLE